MSVANVLSMLKGDLESENRWTSTSLALTSDGSHCSAIDERAVRFSLAGALDRIACDPRVPSSDASLAISVLASELALMWGLNVSLHDKHVAADLVLVFSWLADHRAVMQLIERAFNTCTEVAPAC